MPSVTIDGFTVALSDVEAAAIGAAPMPGATPLPPPAEVPDAIADHWEAWVRGAARSEIGLANHVLHTPPFDGVPDRATAAWWAAYSSEWGPQPGHEDAWDWSVPYAQTPTRRIDDEQRRVWARRAAHDPTRPLPPAHHAGMLFEHLDVAVVLALRGPSGVDHEQLLTTATQRRFAAARVLYAPRLDAATRGWWQRIADGDASQLSGGDPERNLQLYASGVINTRADHAEVVAHLLQVRGAELFLGRPHGGGRPWVMSRRLSVAAFGAAPDRRRELWETVQAAARAERGTPPWQGLASAIDLALFGAPLLAFAAAHARTTHADRTGVLAHLLLDPLEGSPVVPAAIEVLAAQGGTGARVAADWLTSRGEEVAAYPGPIRPASLPWWEHAVLAARAAGALSGAVAEPHARALVERVAVAQALPVLDAAHAWWPQWQSAVAAEDAAPVEGKVSVPKRRPGWYAALPPVVIGAAPGGPPVRLDADQAWAVIVSAMRGVNETSRQPRPLVGAVRAVMHGADRDLVATALLRGWSVDGLPSAQRGRFHAAGYLGADGFVAELATFMDDWPGPRVRAGLEVLAETGTDAAVGALARIANATTVKAVTRWAEDCLARVATVRGLSPAQLQDRVVDDAGLDGDGHAWFDFGPRRIRVGLEVDLTPLVRLIDADGRPVGKPRASLPSANSKDAPELVAAAKKEFAALRKRLRAVVTTQTVRLEQALVMQRAWSGAEFEAYVSSHPILRRLIAGLAWAVTPEAGPDRVLVRFDVEDGFLDVEDRDVAVGADATLRLAHPATASESDRAAWRQHLADHDLAPPFAQFDRLADWTPGAAQQAVAPRVLLRIAEPLGWRLVQAGREMITELTLAYDGPESGAEGPLEGVLTIPGVVPGNVLAGPPQMIERAWVRARATGIEATDPSPVLAAEVARTAALARAAG